METIMFQPTPSLSCALRGLHTPVLALLALTACDGSSPTDPAYDPDLPAAWASAVTNAFFPLVPGTRWEYEGETEDGTETVVVEVLADTREVNGVEATVVLDQVYLDGDLIERTFDWYAQDAEGNVWYLGEESEEIENGQVVSAAGSWEWGVDGALPGIYMWADPTDHVGEAYRQEYFLGEAEDWGKVLTTSAMVEVPFGEFANCVQTEDWNALEGRAESLEHKFYCPGIGVVLELPVDAPEERVELVELED
jgi:hypothetical protein